MQTEQNLLNVVVLCLPIKGIVQIALIQSANSLNAPTYIQRTFIGVERQMKLSHFELPWNAEYKTKSGLGHF